MNADDARKAVTRYYRPPSNVHPNLLGGLVVALVSPRNPASWKTALALGIAAALFFVIVGEADRLPWLVVVLSLIYVAFLLRFEPVNNRHPRSKNEAFRE